MSCREFIFDLEERDVSLAVVGDRLKVNGPDEVLTDELLATLHERKSDLLAYFRGDQSHQSDQRSPAVANPDDFTQMPLAEFARSGLVLRVKSTILGCELLFAADNVPEAAIRSIGLPIYRAAELRKLATLRPEPQSLRTLHEVKGIFGATIARIETTRTADHAA